MDYLYTNLPHSHSELGNLSQFEAHAEYIKKASNIDDVPVHYYKLFKVCYSFNVTHCLIHNIQCRIPKANFLKFLHRISWPLFYLCLDEKGSMPICSDRDIPQGHPNTSRSYR